MSKSKSKKQTKAQAQAKSTTNPQTDKQVAKKFRAEKIAAKLAETITRDDPQAMVTKRQPKNQCLCGCGQLCWKNFKQGHDQRVRGMLLRGELTESVRRAVSAGVLVGEVKRANQEVLA
jgi:hypothetical protein